MNLVSNPKVELRGHVKAKIRPAVHRKRYQDKFKYMFDGEERRMRRRRRKIKESKEKSLSVTPKGINRIRHEKASSQSDSVSSQTYAILNGTKHSQRLGHCPA